jgi:NADH:ubiquinone oxidoreductase subunit E
VPDPAYRRFEPIDPTAVDDILERLDHDPGRLLEILEATQAVYGFLPVAVLKRISHATGAWYAMVYGTASYYRHFRFEPPTDATQAAAVAAQRPDERAYLDRLGAALGGRPS